jgi:ribosomal protein S18 acetylase RimI-like enzyme
MRSYRRLQDEGHGFWLGGWVGGRLVADLGLFARDGLARYQHVETHPAFRRQGIARRMVHEAAVRGAAAYGIDTFVIVADPDYHAIELYRSLGFEGTEDMVGVERSVEG